MSKLLSQKTARKLLEGYGWAVVGQFENQPIAAQFSDTFARVN